MNLILFDDPLYKAGLFPLTLTRPVSEIRVGILTLTQKWEKYMGAPASFLTSDYLAKKYSLNIDVDNLLINGAVCPDKRLVDAIKRLQKNSSLLKNGILLAIRHGKASYLTGEGITSTEYHHDITLLDHPWKIFQYNGAQIRCDHALITKGKKSARCNNSHTVLYGTLGENIFIEEGAVIKAATLNAEAGPIYLGKNTQVQEGALIRGPFALCEGSHVNMGTKIRGDSTVGPYSKVGGEISNSVIFGYTNKAHDGFLGNSVLGEWCNLGAGTTVSNLKNNYGDIKVWDHTKQEFSKTGLQFCGLIMGDYSQCSILTAFNTGSIVGVGCSIFGIGLPPKWIPSFTWGGVTESASHRINDLINTIGEAMQRRSKLLQEEEKNIINFLFEHHQTSP